MGTRCAALIKSEGCYSEYYYRHWDGCPANAGVDLLSMTQALEWNPEAICKVLKSRRTEYDGLSDENAIYVVFHATGFESAEDLPLDDPDYFYLIDFERKEIRCYEHMFKINAHDLASQPPFRILKWSKPILNWVIK